MGKASFTAIGFVASSAAEEKMCFDIANKFFGDRDFLVVRCDVLYPFRKIQEYAYQILNLPDSSDPNEAVSFKTDDLFMDLLFELFKSELGPTLKKRIEKEKRQAKLYPMVVITTDCQNKAYNSMRDIGYTIIRIESATRESTKPKSHNHCVEEDHLVTRDDFKKSPELALAKIFTRIIRKNYKSKATY